MTRCWLAVTKSMQATMRSPRSPKRKPSLARAGSARALGLGRWLRLGVGLGQRGLEVALGHDDLGAPLALGLGLPGHRALHLGRQGDVLDLDRGDVDAPLLDTRLEDLRDLAVDLGALGEDLVELHPADDRAQRRRR